MDSASEPGGRDGTTRRACCLHPIPHSHLSQGDRARQGYVGKEGGGGWKWPLFDGSGSAFPRELSDEPNRSALDVTLRDKPNFSGSPLPDSTHSRQYSKTWRSKRKTTRKRLVSHGSAGSTQDRHYGSQLPARGPIPAAGGLHERPSPWHI